MTALFGHIGNRFWNGTGQRHYTTGTLELVLGIALDKALERHHEHPEGTFPSICFGQRTPT